MAKRLVFCFDGTWNELAVDEPTNVAKIAQMVRPTARDGRAQIVYYDEGIGTNTNWINRKYQGATGNGLMLKLRDAYRFLTFNYEPGDEIYAFGFSRGAFTARSFVGLVRHAGILDVISANQIERAIAIYRSAPAGRTNEESPEALDFRLANCRSMCVSDKDRRLRIERDPAGGYENAAMLDIRYVGVWDTVAALGVPAFLPGAKAINDKYGFHDAILTSKIKSARHAVAIDEERLTFRPTLFSRERLDELNALARKEHGKDFEEWEVPYQERWFPGVHGAVGGGGANLGLSDGALEWVLAGAKRAGLEVRDDEDSQTFRLNPDPFDWLQNDPAKRGNSIVRRLLGLVQSPRQGPERIDQVALPTLQRWDAPDEALPEGKRYRPESLAKVAEAIDEWVANRELEFKSEYVVQRGDTLYKIAREFLGDGMRYPEIFNANRDRISDPDHILPGMRLRVTQAITSPEIP
ncbi:phospholipase effector Tle1 domain-containing protein [Parerythrobacter aestuarii]|uniref:phospholipase effector Tle1 domain-containing protein n=1 Tax=Parerythrobacter aestuarii TaxID=3020909 RepID=UPI0024DE2905|nr:DUF2235 domain-containing protein [Parerythrobacter aestuarii]